MRIDVELHGSIVPEDFPFHQDLEGVWERRERVSFAGMTVDSLTPEDLLLFLCVHGSRHLWMRLQWICDVAQLVKRQETMDWERIVKQANTSGGWRMFFLGIFLANDVLGMPLPRGLEQGIRHDSQVAKLARRTLRRAAGRRQTLERNVFPLATDRPRAGPHRVFAPLLVSKTNGQPPSAH